MSIRIFMELTLVPTFFCLSDGEIITYLFRQKSESLDSIDYVMLENEWAVVCEEYHT